MFGNKRKKHFKNKLEGIDQMIWDWEFKKFKLEIQREEKRQEYDGLKSRLEVVTTQLKAVDLKSDESKALVDQQVLLESELKEVLESIQGIDAEIGGLPPSAENPEGVTGINQQLDAIFELKEIYKAYVAQELS
jgi:predicted  nucleic acid-binding Zn-ribbon protein